MNDKELLEQVQYLEKQINHVRKALTEITVSSDLKREELSHAKNPNFVQSAPNEKETCSLSGQEPILDGMVLLLVLLSSQIRCAKLLETKRMAIFLLSKISNFCTPACRLDRVLPYFLALFSDGAASIKALALHHILKLLSSVRAADFQMSFERRLYQDYILPSLSLLPTDHEEVVRVEYASAIPELTICAHSYLQKEIALKRQEGASMDQKDERELPFLRDRIVKEIHELISGDKSTSNTRQALAQSVSKLAEFYGTKNIPDLLLLLTTFMNDPDWQMRVTFFDCVISIEEKPTNRSFQILKPSLETGLQDKDPSIVAAALSLATHLCETLELKKESLLILARLATPLLSHSSIAVRAKTIRFLRVLSKSLSAADAFARLLPMTRGLLPQDPFILDSEQLMVESLLIPESNRDGIVTTPRSQRSTEKSERSVGSKFGNEDDHLLLRGPTYTTRLDCSLYQRGLTRHKASLEKVTAKESPPSRNQRKLEHRDLRSKATVLTSELIRSSVKHGSRDSGAAVGASTSAHGSGTHHPLAVNHAMADAMGTRMTDHHGSVQRMTDWRPEGILLAHYAEHRGCVNQVAVGEDPTNPFFVTASNDGTVKVWDLKLVDDDLRFASCATYAAQKGEIVSVSVCESGRSVASASSHGTLHVWRLNYSHKSQNEATSSSSTEQFSGISNRLEIAPEEGAILNVHQWGPLLLYTSQRGVVHAWDVRMKDDAWRIKTDPKEGFVCSLTSDPINDGTWIVTGSSQGTLALWDVRFRLQVKTWTHPSRNEILDVAACTSAAEQIKFLSIKSHGPFVYVVCAGSNEVGLWDVQEAGCKQVFRVISRDETEVKKMELPAALASRKELSTSSVSIKSQSDMKARHQKLRLSHSPSEGIKTVLPIANGSIITAGYDKYIRVWDGIDPKRSFPMSGPCPRNGKEQGMYNFQYSRHVEQGVPIINECCLKSHYQQPTHEAFSRKQNSNHEDCITALSTAYVRERLLISASRDGVVKLWK